MAYAILRPFGQLHVGERFWCTLEITGNDASGNPLAVAGDVYKISAQPIGIQFDHFKLPVTSVDPTTGRSEIKFVAPAGFPADGAHTVEIHKDDNPTVLTSTLVMVAAPVAATAATTTTGAPPPPTTGTIQADTAAANAAATAANAAAAATGHHRHHDTETRIPPETDMQRWTRNIVHILGVITGVSAVAMAAILAVFVLTLVGGLCASPFLLVKWIASNGTAATSSPTPVTPSATTDPTPQASPTNPVTINMFGGTIQFPGSVPPTVPIPPAPLPSPTTPTPSNGKMRTWPSTCANCP